MESNWAEENLRTIRTLMERSAVYRRALAPVMIYLGVLGIMAAIIGRYRSSDTPTTFVLLWFVTAVLGIGGAFFFVRRQAVRDSEAFWSPPTRRVAQAVFPPLLAGSLLGLFALGEQKVDIGGLALIQFSSIPAINLVSFLPSIWGVLYGCALHSAGFFMPRGMKVFGFCIIILSLLSFPGSPFFPHDLPELKGNCHRGHILMGILFGACQLVYGLYLRCTEKGKPTA